MGCLGLMWTAWHVLIDLGPCEQVHVRQAAAYGACGA